MYNDLLHSGIYIEHDDFTGRASYGFTFDGKNGDGNGHGTHVAGELSSVLLCYNIIT